MIYFLGLDWEAFEGGDCVLQEKKCGVGVILVGKRGGRWKGTLTCVFDRSRI